MFDVEFDAPSRTGVQSLAMPQGRASTDPTLWRPMGPTSQSWRVKFVVSEKPAIPWYASATLYSPGGKVSGTLISCLVLWDDLKSSERAHSVISLTEEVSASSFNAKDLAELVTKQAFLALR